MHVSELFSEEELDQALQQGLVTERKHPEHRLWIYNYTKFAQYSREWSEVTLNCRGLIVDHLGKIVARGPRKFFNYGEEGSPEINSDTQVRVTKKFDGSLGILSRHEGQIIVSTRGSFESEQAILWQKMVDTEDYSRLTEKISDEFSVIVEIIHPMNRIVVDYGSEESLKFLGLVGMKSGLIEFRPGDIYIA